MIADIPVLTIDGPSGSGKGTICALVARELGWHLLDSGALYRLVALGALRHDIDLANEAALAEYAAGLDVCFEPQADGSAPRILLEGEVVGDAIRTEASGNAASKVAALGSVREALLQRQRDFLQEPGLVADGRDMGTVVFPQAGVKIFLTASVDERAQRRYKQLKDKGISANLPDLLTEIAERDARDAQRTVSPLKPAADAVVLDTTSSSIEEVRDRVMQLCRERFKQLRQ
ncbi:MAG: (d)CMP kinase [Gammaproteobacteria bacterium]|nr:(d)CMP kinase [Gammaproteobacteria bacterium]